MNKPQLQKRAAKDVNLLENAVHHWLWKQSPGPTNARLVRDLFQCSMDVAAELCVRFNYDPEKTGVGDGRGPEFDVEDL